MNRWLVVLGLTGIAFAIVLWSKREKPQHAAAAQIVKPKPKPKVDISGKRVDPTKLAIATLSGTVKDPNGKPITADVCNIPNELAWLEAQQCVKAVDGHYRIGLLPGSFSLVAGAPRFEPEHATGAPLDPGEARTVDITLKPGGLEVTGVVEDILGGPIAKAHVSALGPSVETDDKGRFSVWVAATSGRNPSVVTAVATGYGPRSEFVKAPGKVTIALAPESAIAGRVIDATGAPLANARVIGSAPTGLVLGQATSGPDGTFTLERLAAGEVSIEASTPSAYGHLEHDVNVGVGEGVEEVVVRVFPAHTVVATVISRGKDCDPKPSLSDWTFHLASSWRDEAGRYHFEGVPDGMYAVELGCNTQPPPLRVDADVEVTWTLPSGGVRGHLSSPFRQTSVRLVEIGSMRPGREVEGVTSYEFLGLAPGRYKLIARALNYEHETEPFEVRDDVIVHDVALERPPSTAKIVGKVVDQKGIPVARGSVQASAFTNDSIPSMGEIVDGHYEVEVPAGMYRVIGYSRELHGDSDEMVKVQDGRTATVDLKLDERWNDEQAKALGKDPDPVSFGGRVVDARGAPVAGAIVNGAELGYWKDPDAVALRTTTRDDGTFTLVSSLDTVKARAYRVGGGTGFARLVPGAANTIVLAPPGTIGGTAIRSDGAVATKFLVRVGDDGPDAYTRTFDHTGGKFALEDPGHYPLALTAVVNGMSGERVILTGPKSDVVLRLPVTSTITGRVVDGATQKPIAGVHIAGRQSVDGWAPWFIHANQVTDEDGRFVLPDLPPGAMMLELTPPRDDWFAQRVNVTVPQRSGDVGEFSLPQARRR